MKSFKKHLLSVSITILIAAILSSGSVLAQQLEEVIITAQKREQSLQDVAASVSAISGEAIGDFVGSGENIRALAGRAPSLQVESSNGRQSPRFYIRGLGNTDFDVNANQPVSLILDEVALENSVLRSLPLFDIKRVEVLNGPQGSLFGRNTNAGLVKIDSVRPSYDTEGYFSAGYGSRETSSLEFAAGGKLAEGVASRISFKFLDREPWIDNTVNGPGDDFGGFTEYAYRLQFLLEPNDDLTALVKLHGFDQDGDQPQIFYGNALTPGSEGTRPGFDEEIASQDGSSEFFLEHFGISANVQYDFGNIELTSITAYDTVESFSRADIDGGQVGGPEAIGTLGRQAFFNVESGDGLDDHSQFSQELRISGETGKLFYQYGLFYFDEDITVRSVNFDSATTLATDTTFVDQQTTSTALFGQIAYELTDATSVTVGLRYTDDQKDLEVVPGVGSSAPAATISADDSYVSGDIAVNHTVNENLSVYSRLGNASRGPVTIGRFGFTSSAETETLTSIEFGFKAEMLDGTARWNGAIYAYEIEDQQLTATGGATNSNRLLNSDKTVGQGIETDFEWLATENFRLIANLSYNDTEIQDNTLRAEQCGSAPSCTGLDPVVGVFPGPFGPITSVSIDGNQLPRSPEWISNLAASYRMPLENNGELYFNTDWNYRSESSIFLYESVEFVAESRVIGGLRVGYKNSAGNLDLAIVGRNITDEIVVDGGLDFLNLTAFVNEPRFWGLEAKYSF